MTTASLNRLRVVLEESSYRRLLGGQIRAAHLSVPILMQQTLNSASAELLRVRDPRASQDNEPMVFESPSTHTSAA